MAISNRNVIDKLVHFVAQKEVGANDTYPVYTSPLNKKSVIKKILITNNTGIPGTYDISYHTKKYILGGNLFAIIGASNTSAATSTDGITWTLRTSWASYNWNRLSYGKNKFLSTSNNSQYLSISTDGITWTYSVLPVSTTWQQVEYGKDRFVAISYSTGWSGYSTDAITWTSTNVGAVHTNGLTYGNDIFATVVFGSAEIRVSTDGISWVPRTIPLGNWLDIACGRGTFVCVQQNTPAAYSTDGINWGLSYLPAWYAWQGIKYSGGLFTVLAASSPTVNGLATSTDGVTWTLRALPASDNWRTGAVYGNGKYVAITNSTRAAYSTDGITWSASTLPISASWMDIAFPINADFSNETYLYKSVPLGGNATVAINKEIVVLEDHEIRVRSTVPLDITVMGER